jgi:hypothetical protein
MALRRTYGEEIICGEGIYLWRGDLSPLGCEAAPNANNAVVQAYRVAVGGLLRSPAGINPLATSIPSQGSTA